MWRKTNALGINPFICYPSKNDTKNNRKCKRQKYYSIRFCYFKVNVKFFLKFNSYFQNQSWIWFIKFERKYFKRKIVDNCKGSSILFLWLYEDVFGFLKQISTFLLNSRKRKIDLEFRELEMSRKKKERKLSTKMLRQRPRFLIKVICILIF